MTCTLISITYIKKSTQFKINILAASIKKRENNFSKWIGVLSWCLYLQVRLKSVRDETVFSKTYFILIAHRRYLNINVNYTRTPNHWVITCLTNINFKDLFVTYNQPFAMLLRQVDIVSIKQIFVFFFLLVLKSIYWVLRLCEGTAV